MPFSNIALIIAGILSVAAILITGIVIGYGFGFRFPGPRMISFIDIVRRRVQHSVYKKIRVKILRLDLDQQVKTEILDALDVLEEASAEEDKNT